MNHVTLGDAIDEARRFLRLAQALAAATKKDQFLPAASKDTAAVKRASMDLTRALSIMRRPS